MKFAYMVRILCIGVYARRSHVLHLTPFGITSEYLYTPFKYALLLFFLAACAL